MVKINCKLFYNNRCGYSRRYKTGSWNDISKNTNINDHDINYEIIELSKNTENIFKEYNIKSYPRTLLCYNDRVYTAIIGDQKYETCIELIKKSIDIISSDEKIWEFEKELQIKEENEQIQRRINKRKNYMLTQKFMQLPHIKVAFNEFVKKENT